MEDPRCCGSGTCIINKDGLCWCGQQWDGERMCAPQPGTPAVEPEIPTEPSAGPDAD